MYEAALASVSEWVAESGMVLVCLLSEGKVEVSRDEVAAAILTSFLS